MSNGAHDAIDSKISRNSLNPNNIKNQVDSETLDMYGLFEDYMFNMGTAIFNAKTKGGDNRFYKRNFSMPSTYGLDDNEPYSTKDQMMQVLANSIQRSPDDTVSTQSVQDLYDLHKQPMPKYKKGGKVKSPKLKDLTMKEIDEILRSKAPGYKKGNFFLRSEGGKLKRGATKKSIDAITALNTLLSKDVGSPDYEDITDFIDTSHTFYGDTSPPSSFYRTRPSDHLRIKGAVKGEPIARRTTQELGEPYFGHNYQGTDLSSITEGGKKGNKLMQILGKLGIGSGNQDSNTMRNIYNIGGAYYPGQATGSGSKEQLDLLALKNAIARSQSAPGDSLNTGQVKALEALDQGLFLTHKGKRR